MNCVIISDVHGNLEALLAVKKKIAEIAPDEVLFLGDAVGYGAAPNECIEVLREMTGNMVAGNHDFGAVQMTDTRLFNPIAREAIDWTSDALTSENRELLKRLEKTKADVDELLTRASSTFEKLRAISLWRRLAAAFGGILIFIGAMTITTGLFALFLGILSGIMAPEVAEILGVVAIALGTLLVLSGFAHQLP